ncbi:TPA: hypothetical protein ACGUTA_004342 [Vibrio vulnificus]
MARNLGEKQYWIIKSQVLDFLDATYDSANVHFSESSIEFDFGARGTETGISKRKILYDVLVGLEQSGLITHQSTLSKLPIIGLRLTPKGGERARSLTATYKQAGLVAFIKAAIAEMAKYVMLRFLG